MSDPLGDALEFEVVAASLRMGREDLAHYLAELASRLVRVLPGRITVERTGVLKRTVSGIDINLGPNRYGIALNAGRLTCTVATVVRGVVLRTEERELDPWLAELSRELVAVADASLDARVALERIIR